MCHRRFLAKRTYIHRQHSVKNPLQRLSGLVGERIITIARGVNIAERRYEHGKLLNDLAAGEDLCSWREFGSKLGLFLLKELES